MTADVSADGPRIRPAVGSPHSRILGIGAYRPSRVVTNDEVCERIDSSDAWIRERSGIVTRRFAAPEETVVDMSVAAAGKALASAGLTPADVDAVLVATITHPYQTPAAAPMVAARMGLDSPAALDLSVACAGFTYGVGLASDMIRGGSARHVLVIGVEKLSDFVDPTDRSTAFIFGDGAGAVVVGPSDTPMIGPTVWGSDGSKAEAIIQARSWVDLREDPQAGWPALTMQGQAVFRWAVWQMAPVARAVLEAAGVTPDELGAFVPHQANLRITDAMLKELKLPEHVAVGRDIVDSGNTSAASIPLALDRLLETGEARSGQLALLLGFGAGLAYAGQVVVLP